MKILVQQSGSGEFRIAEVPSPRLRPGGVIVRTCASVVSIGTDRIAAEFGRKSLVGKALERPEQVRRVFESALRDGIATTVGRVRNKLETSFAPGYSSAGVVEAVGPGVREFEVGQRVACSGAGYAVHAERVWVPERLVSAIPTGVSFEAAAFTTMGAIALHGVRQAKVELGEVVVVIGLGLLGLLTVQLLQAAGTRVVAVDLDPEKVELAGRLGATAVLRHEGVEATVSGETGGIGADAVIVAAATSSEDPVQLAGELSRDRGRVVVVGAVPLNVPRSPYYEKEIDVRLSRSYGPGRYDPSYEEQGHDYPVGYVRWTEGRNFQSFLQFLALGDVTVDPLVTHRFQFARADDAYREVMDGDTRPTPLGVVLEFPRDPEPEPARIEARTVEGRVEGRVGLGLIGSGSFAQDTLIPHLKRLPVDLRGIVSAQGLSAQEAAMRHGFSYSTGSIEEVFSDEAVHAVVISTPHADHADLAERALHAGKAVFVEKPLALRYDELRTVLGVAQRGPPLMVGFNRRFAPATQLLMAELRSEVAARVIHIRVSAGRIPEDHWIHDPEVGGGRLIGECCHFVDLATLLAGAKPEEVVVRTIGHDPDALLQDNFVLVLRFENGSVASITYTSKGDPSMGKERIEVFAGGTSGYIDDFRRAEVWRQGKRMERWKGRQDKGHLRELEAFLAAVKAEGEAPIPLEELEASSLATLVAADALRSGRPTPVTWPAPDALESTKA